MYCFQRNFNKFAEHRNSYSKTAILLKISKLPAKILHSKITIKYHNLQFQFYETLV